MNNRLKSFLIFTIALFLLLLSVKVAEAQHGYDWRIGSEHAYRYDDNDKLVEVYIIVSKRVWKYDHGCIIYTLQSVKSKSIYYTQICN